MKGKKEKLMPIWFRCPDCRISQSYGCIEYEGLKPACPDCHGPMTKEVY